MKNYLPRLLIVDDEEGIRRALQKMLKSENYEIHTAENGEQAIQLTQEFKGQIDIVICDYKMPGINGLETLIAIGQLNPGATRIILTGYATLESAIQATNEGLDGFIIKPFDNEELKQKVRHLFLRRRLREAVSTEMMREFIANPQAVQSNRMEATILSSRFRCGESDNPEHFPGIFSEHYLNPLTEWVFKEKGIVNQGDGHNVNAIFGAPTPKGDEALRAVRTAVRMRQQMKTIRAMLADDPSYEIFQLGWAAGIASGEVMAGLFNSRNIRVYSAFGPAVHLASQLQSVALDDHILICPITHSHIEDHIEVEAIHLREPETNADLAVFNVVRMTEEPEPEPSIH